MWEALVGAVAGAMTMFGASTTGDHKMPRMENENRGSTTMREMKGDMRDKFGGKASSTIAANVPCVATATAAREASLSTAVITLNSDIAAAYTARSSALAAAYAQTDTTLIKSSVKSAWQQFAGATKASKKTWQKSREDAWSAYKTALKSCGNGATSVSDAGNAGSEISGQ